MSNDNETNEKDTEKLEATLKKLEVAMNVGDVEDGELVLPPQEILEELHKDVVGQDEPKKDIALAVANHINGYYAENDAPKTNIVIIGDTGSGKTLMMKVLGRIVSKVGFSVSICDATKITEDGYMGLSAESVLTQLYRQCHGDIEKTERSIVYIDEVDKLLYDPKFPEGRVGVFTSFLKIIEGGSFTVPAIKEDETITIDTTNILFIIGGVCSGLDESMQKEDKDKPNPGLIKDYERFVQKSKAKEEEENTTPIKREADIRDLIKFGFPIEFIARFSVVTRLEPLSYETLYKILVEKKMPEFKKSYDMNKKTLNLSDYEKDMMVKYAQASKLGARGLDNLLFKNLREAVLSVKPKKYMLN